MTRLPIEHGKLFYKIHPALMFFVNERLHVVPDEMTDPREYRSLPPEARIKVRDALHDQPDLIDAFVRENSFHFTSEELDIVASWKEAVVGSFYIFRYLKNYTVFLGNGSPNIAYGVLALADPLDELVGPYLPILTNAVLLPFKGKIIYDGLLSSYNITFGGGIKRSLNDSYREAKQRLGIVTSLPIESIPIPATKTKKKQKSNKATRSGAKDVKPIVEAIVGISAEFCREYLNDEYAELCRKLAEKLSRKRPSPLLRGKPKTWACGIIRTIGWVNFLDDPASQPHMKLTAIDKAIGVGKSTGQGKSMEIRKMLKIRDFGVDWTLPSRIDDNPRVWMLEINGFLVDVRDAPREIQEVAFAKGLIPYIPAERETGSVKDDDDHKVVSSSDQLYQFKITLNESKPAIWRRIQVKDCTLDKLHEHIQTAMGWTNSHLHQFEINGKPYGDPELLDDGFMGSECADSTVVKISDIVPQDGGRFRFLYEYDFGDGWEHEVLFEGRPPAELGQQFPRCLEGQRACPPEDVGGVWGYEEYLEALADPSHERHDELLEWSGLFEPDAFDAAETTQHMRRGLPARR